MNNRHFRTGLVPLVLVFIGVMSFSTVAQAAWLWSPESGKWTNAKDVPRDVPQEQYEAGTQYYDDEDYAGAVDE